MHNDPSNGEEWTTMDAWITEHAPPALPPAQLLVELLEAGNTLAELAAGQLTFDPDELARALERWQRVVVRAAAIHQTQGGKP
jgi:hypothetical protein